LKRYEGAIQHLQQAKTLDPKLALLPGYFLATLFDDLGRDEAAIAEYAAFLKVNPEYPARAEIEYRVRQLCDRQVADRDALGICSGLTQ
jgi:tetratricopeptide (TPR) repeat protein